LAEEGKRMGVEGVEGGGLVKEVPVVVWQRKARGWVWREWREVDWWLCCRFGRDTRDSDPSKLAGGQQTMSA
jgi:hypothetical protein